MAGKTSSPFFHPVSVVPSPDRHPAAAYIARLSPGSRRSMSEALNTVASLVSNAQASAETLPWAELRYQHTTLIRAALIERYKPATANKVLSALRGVLKECWHLGTMTAEDYYRACDVPKIMSNPAPRGRVLATSEIGTLMGVCGRDSSPKGVRDAALIAVLYGAGLKRSEAVNLDVQDCNQETGELVIRSAQPHRDRLAYTLNGSAKALEEWLAVRGDGMGPLFCRVTRGGRIEILRLPDQSVLNILRKRGTEAGVAPFSPHDLRRSFISDLLDAGADISTAQQLAGHKNVQTTVRYDLRGEAARKKAAELLHVPHVQAIRTRPQADVSRLTDVKKLISELRAEREEIDRAILSLERSDRDTGTG